MKKTYIGALVHTFFGFANPQSANFYGISTTDIQLAVVNPYRQSKHSCMLGNHKTRYFTATIQHFVSMEEDITNGINIPYCYNTWIQASSKA